MPKFIAVFRIFSISALILFLIPEQALATNYNGTWTSVVPSNTTLGALANYTLTANNPGSTGGGTANSYVPSGKTIVVTFPSGYTLSTVSGGSVDGTAIASGFTTTATTITFNTPVAIAKGTAFTIVLNGITNSGTSGCYQLSMAIDNATGTGSGNQNLFASGANSQYTLGSGVCYCIPTSNCGAGDFITNYDFETINNNSGGCAGSTSGYTDYPASSYTATLIPSLTYIASITVGTYAQGVGIWIDFDQNGTLAAAEFFDGGIIAANGTGSINILVPANALAGLTRMRVRSKYNAAVTSGEGCTNFTYGETEDYTITINPLTACSGTPGAGTTTIDPTSGCTGAVATLSSTGSSLNDGLTYQWQKSEDGGATWSNIGSAMAYTPSNYSDSPTASCSYRLYVICSNSGISSTSNVEAFTLTTGTLSPKTWIGKGAGGTGTDFNAAANWNPASPPVSCDSIRMILNSAAVITMSADATIGALVYNVSGGVTCELDVQTRLLTINNTSTYDGTGSGTWAQVNVKSAGAGIINNGNCIFHNAGTGTTYLYSTGTGPGKFQLNANLTVGTGGRTAAGVEPILIFDAPVAQSWITNSTVTYFLGEDVIFGLTNSPVITMGGGALTTLSVYDGNVQINNSTIVKAMNVPIDRYTGSGTWTMASGSKLELNYTNDLPAPYSFALNANSTVEYLGAASAQSINGITYGHLIAGGSGTKSAIGNSIIQGNFLVRSGSTYRAANSTTLRTHNFRGNFTNDGTFTTNASFPSTFIMDGTIDQYIQGAVSSTFYNLTVNKSTGVGYLGINTQVGTGTVGVTAFTAGPLNLNAYNLTINNPATGAVTRSSGYAISENVNNASKIQWNVGSTTGSHIYPFGTVDGTYIPFTLNLTAGTIGNVTLSTYPTAVNNTPYPVTPDLVTNVNGSDGTDNSLNTVDRFWQIDKTGVSGTATLTFMATAAEVGSIGTLLAQRWNTAIPEWEAPTAGQTSLATGAIAPGITNFSPWTLSGNDMPLPIELIAFDASYNGENVDLFWSTATEFDNDYFTVERTVDGEIYREIAVVDGAGTSYQKLDYATVDTSPHFGTAFYRLKQTDFDGEFKYSTLKAVTIQKGNEDLEVYPNPTNDHISISFNTQSTNAVRLNIMDATGRLVLSRDIDTMNGKNTVDIDVYSYSNGIYFISIQKDDEILKTKFVKE